MIYDIQTFYDQISLDRMKVILYRYIGYTQKLQIEYLKKKSRGTMLGH